MSEDIALFTDCDINDVSIAFDEIFDDCMKIEEPEFKLINNIDYTYDKILDNINDDFNINNYFFNTYEEFFSNDEIIYSDDEPSPVSVSDMIVTSPQSEMVMGGKKYFNFDKIHNIINVLCPNISKFIRFGGDIIDEGKELLRLLYLYDSNHDFGKPKGHIVYRYILEKFNSKIDTLYPPTTAANNAKNAYFKDLFKEKKGFSFENKIVNEVKDKDFFSTLFNGATSSFIINFSQHQFLTYKFNELPELIKFIHIFFGITTIYKQPIPAPPAKPEIDDPTDKSTIIDTTLILGKLLSKIIKPDGGKKNKKGKNKSAADKDKSTELFYDKMGEKLEPFENAFDPHPSTTLTIPDDVSYQLYKNIIDENFNYTHTPHNFDDSLKAVRTITNDKLNFHIYPFEFDLANPNKTYHPCIELKNINQHNINDFKKYIEKYIVPSTTAVANDLTNIATASPEREFKIKQKKKTQAKKIAGVTYLSYDGYLVYKNGKIYLYYKQSFNEIAKLKQVIQKILDYKKKRTSGIHPNSLVNNNELDNLLNTQISTQNNILSILIIYLFISYINSTPNPTNIYTDDNIDKIVDILLDLKKAGDWGQGLFCSNYNKTKPNHLSDCLFISGDQLSAIRSIFCENVDTMFSSKNQLFLYKNNVPPVAVAGGSSDKKKKRQRLSYNRKQETIVINSQSSDSSSGSSWSRSKEEINLNDPEIMVVSDSDLRITIDNYRDIYLNIINLLNFHIFEPFFDIHSYEYNKDEYGLFNNLEDKKYIYKYYLTITKYIFIFYFISNKFKKNYDKVLQKIIKSLFTKHEGKSLFIINDKLPIKDIEEIFEKKLIKIKNIKFYISFIHKIDKCINDNIQANIATFNYNFILKLYKLYDIFHSYDHIYNNKKIIIKFQENYYNYMYFYHKLFQVLNKYRYGIVSNELLSLRANIKQLQLKYYRQPVLLNDKLYIEYRTDVSEDTIIQDIILSENKEGELEAEYDRKVKAIDDEYCLFVIEKLVNKIDYIIRLVSKIDPSKHNIKIRLNNETLKIINIYYHHHSSNKITIIEIIRIIDNIYRNLMRRERNIDKVRKYYCHISKLYNYYLRNHLNIFDEFKRTIDNPTYKSDYTKLKNNIIRIVMELSSENIDCDIGSKIINKIKNCNYIRNKLSSISSQIVKNNIYKFFIANIYIIIENYLKISNGLKYYFKFDDNDDIFKYINKNSLKDFFKKIRRKDKNFKELRDFLTMFYNCFIYFYENSNINSILDKQNFQMNLEKMHHDVFFNNF